MYIRWLHNCVTHNNEVTKEVSTANITGVLCVSRHCVHVCVCVCVVCVHAHVCTSMLTGFWKIKLSHFEI